jgi:predicted lysophospholipase L1 biosynthesis ABC-type transport system permease subunit
VAAYRIVSPGYFQAMGIPLRRGRYLGTLDRDDATLAAVINDASASRYWPHESPVGRRIRLGDDAPWITIVGVVNDVRHTALDRPPQPELYLARAQVAAAGGLGTWRTMSLVARVRGAPEPAIPMIRRVLASMDPNIPLSRVRTMDAVVSQSVSSRGLVTRLVGLFAIATATLATIGIYGVVAYFVRSRQREIAIRRALGADPARIARVITDSVLHPMAAGVAIGLLGGAAVNHALRGVLFEVTPLDPSVFALATVGLVGVLFLAGLAGGRRALSQDLYRDLRD